jgi:hypothetical protein
MKREDISIQGENKDMSARMSIHKEEKLTLGICLKIHTYTYIDIYLYTYMRIKLVSYLTENIETTRGL